MSRAGLSRDRPFPLLLALRYLRSTRRDAFISFLSATAAGGLTLGATALVLALAALNGFQTALRDEVLARTPQIEIELPAGTDAALQRDLLASRGDVVGARLELRGSGWLVATGHARPVSLIGFEGELPSEFETRETTSSRESGRRGDGAWLPRPLGEAWDLELGQPVEIVSGRPTLTPFGLQPRIRRIPVAGWFEPGRTEIEDRVAVPLADATALLAGSSQRILVDAGGLSAAVALAPRLAREAPAGSTVRTWQELNRGLFFALKLEKSLMFLAIFLIVVVAALALVSDLHLLIASKRPEIGMLGAMGARPEVLRRAFLLLGTLLSTAGVLLGTLLGIVGAWILDSTRALRLPGRIYFLDYVPFVVEPGDLSVIVGTSLALAAACSYWAARRATVLSPVEALRR